MEWNGKTYTYSMVFCDSELVMESLLEGQSWIFSRLKDNPDFALDPSYLNELGKDRYETYKGISSASLLNCFKPGEELLKEIKNIIVVDEWMEMGHQEFIRKFKSAFDLSYNKLINELINEYGFSEDYEKLDEDNETLISARKSGIKIPIELTGSGFHRLLRLYPLMVASKEKRLMMIATDPYDYCLHPILGRALMKWFLKDNPNPPIGRLTNVVI
jgi:AAA15 family ATPase/GTPase